MNGMNGANLKRSLTSSNNLRLGRGKPSIRLDQENLLWHRSKLVRIYDDGHLDKYHKNFEQVIRILD